MNSRVAWIQRLRFLLATGGLYLVTIGFVYYAAASSASAPAVHVTPIAIQHPSKPVDKPVKVQPEFVLISGKPVRLVIPTSGIDLLVDEGYYDQSTGTWTLSSSHAQFAMLSILANNRSGNTFIYGHGTHQVLGKLVTTPPTSGSVANVYTDNGHIFSYIFQSSRDLQPSDTSVFGYTGPPILTIQTCTGSVSEWRTMYQFAFNKVTQQ